MSENRGSEILIKFSKAGWEMTPKGIKYIGMEEAKRELLAELEKEMPPIGKGYHPEYVKGVLFSRASLHRVLGTAPSKEKVRRDDRKC